MLRPAKPSHILILACFTTILLIHNSDSSLLMKKIDPENLDNYLDASKIQFFLVSRSCCSEDVKETKRRIEGMFKEIAVGAEMDERGAVLVQQMEIYEVNRDAAMERRFGLQKQFTKESVPVRMERDPEGWHYSFMS